MRRALFNSFLTFLLLVSVETIQGQGEANIWYFGNRAGLDFNTNPPTPLTNGALLTSEGCASISNKNGQLLFYTDGITVWTKNHTPMPNGNAALLGNPSSTQSAIIVPKPGTYNITTRSYDNYYVVTVDYNGGASGVRFSEINMTLNGGLGDVILAGRNTHLYGTTTTERICVARHSNGCDFWVVGRNVGEINFRSYLISNSGFNTTPVFSPVTRLAATPTIGSLKASPNNLMIADVHASYSGAGGGLYVYNFNNTTGILTDKFSDNTVVGATQEYSAEFSPDNTKLYYTILQQPNIYQYDLTTASTVAFIASRQIIGATTPPNLGSYTAAALQSGPDKKIYVALNGKTNIGVINNPNASGVACNYSDQSIGLGGRACVLGLPALTASLVQDKIDILNSKVCNSLTNDYNFMLSSTTNVLSVNWTFIPQSNPTNSISTTGITTLMTFPATGIYTVVASIAYNCNNDLITTTVNINPMPVIDAGNTQTICVGATASLTATVGPDAYDLQWQPAISLNSYTITNPVASPNATTIYTLSTKVQVGGNLVTNGDFESGANGFSSQYLQSPGNQVLAAPGYWSVGNTILNGWWANCQDHTPGSGINMMFLDGADGTGSVPVASDFWCQTVSVQPNTDYVFYAWLTNANAAGATSQLLFSVNGTGLGGPINTPIGTCVWNQFSATWNSGSNTTANICVAEAGGGQPGNDFAIDDISFYQLCTITDTVRVRVNPLPVVTTNTAAICIGQQTATLTAVGAQTYTWSTGAITAGITQSPAVATNYTVTGTDAHGCVNTATTTIAVNPLPMVTIAGSSTICVGQQTATLTAAGAQTYTWSTTATTASITLSPALTTNYTVTGTDANGCTNTATAGILVNTLPLVTANSSTICIGQQTATLTAAGAQTYTWSTTATTSSITLSPALTTNYTVTGTNANGCTNTATAGILVNTLPPVTASSSTICLGQQTATLTATGAQTYTWSTNATTAGISPNPTITTTYTVTGTDANNCTNTATTGITVYAIPTASFTADSVCLGSTTQLTDVSNGNGSPLSNYNWDYNGDGIIDATGVANPSHQFSNWGNTAVNYTVSSSPQAGLICTHSLVKNIWVHPKPVPAFSLFNTCINTQPNTFDASNSTIAVGTNTLYSWNYGDGTNGAGVAVSHTYTNATVYPVTLTVVSAKGCIATLTNTTEVYPKPHMSILADKNICLGQAMNVTAVSLPGGGSVTNWLWDFNNSIATIEGNGQSTNYIFSGAGSQTVSLVSVSDKGCKDTLSRTVYINHVPDPLFSVDDPDGCAMPKHCVILSDNTAAVPGPAQNTERSWIFGDGTQTSTSGGLSESHCYSNNSSSQVASYTVKLIIKTDSGCVNSLEKQNHITVYPKPLAAYDVTREPGTVIEPFVQFMNHSRDYTSWRWEFGDGPGIDVVNQNPNHFYNSETATTYYSSLTVVNQYGCRDSAFVPVEIRPAFVFYIPNTFTPGKEDGVNDVFTGKGIGIENYEMWIYDRWGEQLYYTNDISQGWNGKKRNNGEYVKQDVYVWKVILKDVLGVEHEYAGHVNTL